MKRLIVVLLALGLLAGLLTGFASAAGTNTMHISLRVEGVTENIYNNDDLTIAYSGETLTVTKVMQSLSSISGTPNITLSSNDSGTYISKINNLSEHTYGTTDGWNFRVNSTSANMGMDVFEISEGDEIVIYYGDKSGSVMQYPTVDLSKMISDGIVKFTCINTSNPIIGANVLWDGMDYITDDNGEIIIDSTGAEVEHYLQIERNDAKGVPTVLRFPPDYYVIFGEKVFVDVAAGSWYYDSVIFVVDNNLFNGTSDTKFSPSMAMNREMFVTVLGRMAGVTVDHSTPTGFSDVVTNNWSPGYIAWAATNGIVTGYDDGTFRQQTKITREQIAVILYRYANLAGYPTDESASLTEFKDSEKISIFATEAMGWAVGAGIITGMDDNTLRPTDTATRAQVAIMLQRFIYSYGS